MTDAVSHTSAALATASGAASVTAGTVFGVEFYVIGLALLGGAVSHIWITKRMGLSEVILSIFGSTVLGVIAALLSYDIVLAVSAEQIGTGATQYLKEASPQAKMLVAFLVSFFAQKGVPILFKWMDKKGERA